MKLLTYLVSLVCALPCAAFALGVLLLDHVIATRNPFKLFYQFLLAFGWGVPLALCAAVALALSGLFPLGRSVVSVGLVLTNVLAILVILRSPAAPKSPAEMMFLLPALLSALLAGYLVVNRERTAVPSSTPQQPAVRAPKTPA